MADKKAPPKGVSKLKAGILWGAAQWAVEWFLAPQGGLWDSVGAAAGGFAAGWVTTALLNTLARWKVPGKALGVLGIVLGVAAVSGAVRGLSALFSWFSSKTLEFDVEKLQAFVLSWNVVPAAALGLLTGLCVGAAVGKGGGKKKD